jgi:hypothetical protein
LALCLVAAPLLTAFWLWRKKNLPNLQSNWRDEAGSHAYEACKRLVLVSRIVEQLAGYILQVRHCFGTARCKSAILWQGSSACFPHFSLQLGRDALNSTVLFCLV